MRRPKRLCLMTCNISSISLLDAPQLGDLPARSAIAKRVLACAARLSDERTDCILTAAIVTRAPPCAYDAGSSSTVAMAISSNFTAAPHTLAEGYVPQLSHLVRQGRHAVQLSLHCLFHMVARCTARHRIDTSFVRCDDDCSRSAGHKHPEARGWQGGVRSHIWKVLRARSAGFPYGCTSTLGPAPVPCSFTQLRRTKFPQTGQQATVHLSRAKSFSMQLSACH